MLILEDFIPRQKLGKQALSIIEDSRFKARMAKASTISYSRKYSIPFISAINEAGTKVYVDKHFRDEFNGKSLLKFIKIHEVAEKAALDLFDVDYKVAHEIALHLERQAVELAGLKWSEYRWYTEMYAIKMRDVNELPSDIELTPYVKDPSEVKFLRTRMEQLNTKTVKQKLGIQETKISLQYHKELNPKLWDVFVLRHDVRERLLSLGYMWAEYAHIPKAIINNIVMTGGNANYNYTDKSDIDVHIVFDREALGMPAEYLDDYLKDKKTLWSVNNSVTVKGYPIEFYAQDSKESYPANQGIYSLLHNEWIQSPTRLALDFDHDPLLKKKVMFYIHQIDTMIKNNANLEEIKTLKNKLREMRGAAIAIGGEFSFENLVFKELRNRGYLDKMSKYEKKLKDKELSL